MMYPHASQQLVIPYLIQAKKLGKNLPEDKLENLVRELQTRGVVTSNCHSLLLGLNSQANTNRLDRDGLAQRRSLWPSPKA